MPGIGIGPFRVGISKRGNVYGSAFGFGASGSSGSRRSGGRSSSHADESIPQCKGRTQAGHRCTNKGRYEGYCQTHYKKHQKEVEEIRKELEIKKQIIRNMIRNLQRLDSQLRYDSLYIQLGSLHTEIGEDEEAQNCYMKGLECSSTLFARYPDKLRYAQNLLLFGEKISDEEMKQKEYSQALHILENHSPKSDKQNELMFTFLNEIAQYKQKMKQLKQTQLTNEISKNECHILKKENSKKTYSALELFTIVFAPFVLFYNSILCTGVVVFTGATIIVLSEFYKFKIRKEIAEHDKKIISIENSIKILNKS